jgi:hypothetical protein
VYSSEINNLSYLTSVHTLCHLRSQLFFEVEARNTVCGRYNVRKEHNIRKYKRRNISAYRPIINSKRKLWENLYFVLKPSTLESVSFKAEEVFLGMT